MYVERYLNEIAGSGAVSEIAFYTPLVTQFLHGLLRYPTSNCIVNKSGAAGIPDVRILSTADRSEWIVCEAKFDDNDIRVKTRWERIWRDQIIGKNYISSETVYIILCAPLTFRVFTINGTPVAGVEIFPERKVAIDVMSKQEVPLNDSALRQVLHSISAEASNEQPQYAAFRDGKLTGGYIPLNQETVKHLRLVFEYGLKELQDYCKANYLSLKAEYEQVKTQREEVSVLRDAAGSEMQLLERAQNRQRTISRRYRVAIQLFEEDYPQFKHDQAFAGTDTEHHFEEIFITNTAYIALTRLFFIRICEDTRLTSRKISNEGPGLWSRFVEHIKHQYKDLVAVAFQDASHVYSRLFEETVFDWFGKGNGKLNGILERILLRLNAFSFEKVDRDLLGTVYQYFRPRAERKRLGEYYTPEEVVDYILARTGISTDTSIMSKRILDPACGSFTFGVRAIIPLLRAGEHLTSRNKIDLVLRCLSGRDINPFSVFLSHLSLLFTTLDTYRDAKSEDPDFTIVGFDVANSNSLSAQYDHPDLTGSNDKVNPARAEEQFDYVVGNPPFVRNERLPEEDRNALKAMFPMMRSGNSDIAACFLHCALSWWLKEGGILGMVTPIGQANTQNAHDLRADLARFTIYEIVSLEWIAKEVFPDADIIPMLLFIKKADPPENHHIRVVSGLRTKNDLTLAGAQGSNVDVHVSEIPYASWLGISPTGDWPLDITARDLPTLQKLSKCRQLETVADPSYGIKLGSQGGKCVSSHLGDETSGTRFAKGLHICAFGMSDSEETIELSRLSTVSDPSIWRDLSFYRANIGLTNDTGTDNTKFASNSLIQETLPSDTLCCVVPQVYTTLVAAVINPVETAINNSAMVLVPRHCSAYVLAAVINSQISRYYAFLTMRAAILLRRRSTWYPRTLKHLPWPTLNSDSTSLLHCLATEATRTSGLANQTELDLYIQAMSTVTELTSAGRLGVYLEGIQSTIDTDDLAGASMVGNVMTVGDNTIIGPDRDVTLLARMAAIHKDAPALGNHDMQMLRLPSNPLVRAELATYLRDLAGRNEGLKVRMNQITDQIDTIVAEGLGLLPSEHSAIKARCDEFPLSDTVNRPRYTWSPDRKNQARRMYEGGQRYR